MVEDRRCEAALTEPDVSIHGIGPAIKKTVRNNRLLWVKLRRTHGEHNISRPLWPRRDRRADVPALRIVPLGDAESPILPSVKFPDDVLSPVRRAVG